VVESSPLPEGTVRHSVERVAEFVAAVFRAAGIPDQDAELVSDVLVAADLRGIRSHGVARLPYFVVRLESGAINAGPNLRIDRLTDTTGHVDADNGLGMVASQAAMREAVAMAEAHGSGFVTVTGSNHFGFAGYWADLAMARGLIGIAMSNSGRRVTPTFGTESMLGTNPMAVAIPGGTGGTDFLLDMATSTVAVGKIETALREGRSLPDGWVSGHTPPPALDDRGVLTYDAPLLPLGGEGDETGGHKGYGLSLLVELLCGALAGSALEARIRGADGSAPAAMGHFLGALQVAGFREPEMVHRDMASTFGTLRAAAKAPGQSRVFIQGEPEAIAEEENRRLGIPVTPMLLEQMRRLDDRFGLGFDL
jgi:LDH2 family malate/lactate/ureidoglycolate dehydrogenase